MKITIAKIKSYNPCESGIKAFEEKYPDFADKLSVLLALDDVPYTDKVWLATKVAPLKMLQQWSVECAEMVLPNYEKQFPNDTGVRDCLETAKKVIAGELDKSAAASAARSAASAARSAASAAWSAASAASAAWSAASAAWSAASAASAAWSAASAAWSAASAEKEQEDLNLSILIALLKNERM